MICKQFVAKKLGISGCYFFCIVYLAEQITGKKIDVVELYDVALKRKWIEEDCFMNNPALLMEYLVNKKCSCKHESINYLPKQNEFEITRYELKDTGTTFAHFVVTKNNKIVYDPFGSSRTVKEGNPVSKRIIGVEL